MIHQLAAVDRRAKIGKDVTIEPFTTIAGDVEIGDGTWIGPNVTIMDGARIGKNCRIFPGTVISAIPQCSRAPRRCIASRECARFRGYAALSY